jgi:hypothetical protein
MSDASSSENGADTRRALNDETETEGSRKSPENIVDDPSSAPLIESGVQNPALKQKTCI